METVSSLARWLWRHRPVVTTAQRYQDATNGAYVDGAVWALVNGTAGAAGPTPAPVRRGGHLRVIAGGAA